ncbi:unnamed protein product [Anisakis simplex]|uniref:Uncharacterized protein n=1 Tax=Anisakis simplex TaxID=6269 RepID=A0A3P6U8Q1_ANISI|nr:unnamed protein product [Anisakis simplex]
MGVLFNSISCFRRSFSAASIKLFSATCESWFPFGSPGGGAPNRKYEAFSPQTSDAAAMKTDRRSPSRHSNEDSGRSSGSDTNHPPKEVCFIQHSYEAFLTRICNAFVL